MTARFIVADVFDGLATLEDGSVDLVVTSPPFLALRSYLPADHPDKGKEIGSEATPAEFIDTMLAVTQELRRVLAPHGSIAIELGDTYAGSGGAGGDYNADGLREGQQKFSGSAAKRAKAGIGNEYRPARKGRTVSARRDRIEVDRQWTGGPGWPMPKSKCLIPELYEIALAYGFNPLTGTESPAGQWRIRNVVTWARPNPPVGALGDKWRPATSDVVVACVSGKRYWDDLATRRPHQHDYQAESGRLDGDKRGDKTDGQWNTLGNWDDPSSSAGAPLLDYWEIPPGGYPGSHYAVFPPALVEPLVKAMCPQKVCRTCGEPSRRIVEATRHLNGERPLPSQEAQHGKGRSTGYFESAGSDTFSTYKDGGWTDCGHDDYRPGIVLDPFAGSGTTLAVATGHGHDAIGIDIDERNADLAMERVGPFFFELVK